MKIHMKLNGLAAYLPEPFGNPKKMSILIPDLRQKVHRKLDDGTDIEVCEHRPRLILPDGQEWDLNGEHIEISGGSGGVKIEQSFFDKMSDMKVVAPGSEIVDAAYLEDPPRAPAGGPVPLVADLLVENGTFSVLDSTPWLAFRDSAQGHNVTEGEFAAYVTMVVDVPGNLAVVSTRTFGTKAETHRLELSGGDDDVIDLAVSNHCDALIEDSVPADNDFIIYYDFSFNYRGPKRIPFPAPRPAPPSPQGQPGSSGVMGALVRPGSCTTGVFHARGGGH
jgi:hypothetical protein